MNPKIKTEIAHILHDVEWRYSNRNISQHEAQARLESLFTTSLREELMDIINVDKAQILAIDDQPTEEGELHKRLLDRINALSEQSNEAQA